MSVPKETLWERDPHTAAKHQILRLYLQAWFPILARHNGRIVYFEGFAGPGEYKGKELGSPLVALDVALEQQAHLRNEIVFYFVEADRRRAEHLSRLIEERKANGLPGRFQFEVHHGEFEEALAGVLDELDREGLAIAPTFAFIDPFGFSGLPMTLIHRLLKHPKTEAFINFPIDSVNRFIEHPAEKINAHMAGLFGTPEALSIQAPPGKRYGALRQLYQRQLKQVARHVRFFEMFGPDNQPVYDLFFASNSLKGLEKMKEAMWRVDPSGSFSFRDATDPHQTVLFGGTQHVVGPLLTSILAEFGGQTALPVDHVEAWGIAETPYIATHVKNALRLGEAEGALTVQSRKQGGKPRRGNTFPADALLDFIPRSPPAVQKGLFE